MKKSLILSLLFITTLFASAQTRYFTKNGTVFFTASSPLEKIEATNGKASSIVDISSGAMEFAVLMKAFNFEKALMQEHFNENYVESDKYPKAVFKGNMTNISSLDLTKDGTYPVNIKGQLTLHGVTKDVETSGVLSVKDGSVVSGKSDFQILLSDYNINIPSLVKDKISKEVKITVNANYELLKKS
jgi:hypothetical protein